MKPGVLAFSVLFLTLFSYFSPVFSQGGTNFESGITGVKTGSGLHVASYKVTNGQLKVYLPSDMAVGERVSGSVEFEFYDLGSGELVSRNFNISDYSLVIENRILDLSGENFSFDVPLNLPAGVLNVALEKSNGNFVSRAFFPVRLTKVAQYGKKLGDPSDFRIPATGRAGMPVTVKGPFDGDFGTTKISINGKKVRIIAESPRKMIFESPVGVSGPGVIGLREGSVDIKNTYTNLDVVKVSEDQSFFVSRLQEDSKVVEKAKRGEFIIENEDVEGTLSKWRRLDSGRPKEGSVGEKVQHDKSPMVPEEPGDSQEKKSGVSDTNSAVKDGDKEVETIRQERSYSAKDNDEGTNAERPGKVTMYQEQSPGNIKLVREHLKEQYSARLTRSSNEMSERDDGEPRSSAKPSLTQDVRDNETRSRNERGQRVAKKGSESGAGSKFSLQLASVKRQRDADKIIEKLKLKGYNAYSARVNVPGKGHWYRIKIGGFQTRTEALDFKSSIDLKGIHIKKSSIFVTEDKR